MKYEEASRIKDTLDLIGFSLSVTLHQENDSNGIRYYLRIE